MNEFEHADDDESFDASDEDLPPVDHDDLVRLGELFDAANDPDSSLTPLEALQAIHADESAPDLVVPE